MTNEEAKIFLQSRIKLIDKYYPQVEDYREALGMAIKALEEQRNRDWQETMGNTWCIGEAKND